MMLLMMMMMMMAVVMVKTKVVPTMTLLTVGDASICRYLLL